MSKNKQIPKYLYYNREDNLNPLSYQVELESFLEKSKRTTKIISIFVAILAIVFLIGIVAGVIIMASSTLGYILVGAFAGTFIIMMSAVIITKNLIERNAKISVEKNPNVKLQQGVVLNAEEDSRVAKKTKINGFYRKSIIHRYKVAIGVNGKIATCYIEERKFQEGEIVEVLFDDEKPKYALISQAKVFDY